MLIIKINISEKEMHTLGEEQESYLIISRGTAYINLEVIKITELQFVAKHVLFKEN